MEPPTPTDSPEASTDELPPTPTEAVDDVAADGAPIDTKKAASDGEEYFDDGAADMTQENSQSQDNGKGEEVKAAPQAQAHEPPRRASMVDSEEDFSSVKLSPMDFVKQRQNMKDTLMNNSLTAPPPLAYDEPSPDNGDAHQMKFNEEEEEYNHHQRSALHQDEYSQYNDRQHYNPHNHESALGSGGGGLEINQGKQRHPFQGRKKNRLVRTSEGKKGHSHPRKSPYKSEVGRLRHAQQLEREKRQFGSPGSAGDGKDPPEDEASSTASGKSLGIKDTTAPPDSAFFSIQSSKLKHSLLHSLGEFLTGAFADDEEASGSYFSQDLLDQLSNSNPYLKGVWLQAKNLNDGHIQQLCEALLRNKVVTEVWLPSNQITDVGAGHIAHMLKFNRSIKELFLGGNDIGPKGSAALASALARGNTSLVALGLGDNHIGVEGAGAFAAALRHNHCLHTLDIKNNGIPKKSSIRGLLNKMLEFNASDPGDESLVLGLQEELANLVCRLPPDMAENVVLQAEEALKMAMLCRKRGDKIGAAEAEGVFIRICTTGEPPVDPPEEMEAEGRSQQRVAVVKKKKRGKKPMEPDRLDGLNEELSTLKFKDEGSNKIEEEVGDGEDKDSGEEPKESSGNGVEQPMKESEEVAKEEAKESDDAKGEKGDGTEDVTDEPTDVADAEVPIDEEKQEGDDEEKTDNGNE